MASMDAVFKISQTTYRDRIIRAKNSLKEFCLYFRLAAYDSDEHRIGGNFIPHLML
mgnify:CR=1 FL=1